MLANEIATLSENLRKANESSDIYKIQLEQVQK